MNNIDSGLELILSDMGSGFVYSSILRSILKNEQVGGWSGSQHVDWDKDGDSQAVDILRSSFSGSPEDLARRAYSAGATGVGIYDTHVHVDNNPGRVNNPYFKDLRKNKSKFDEKFGIKSFDYFEPFYNKTLAEARKGKNDNVLSGTNNNKFSNETLIAVGAAVVGILTLLGFDKKD